MTKIDNIRGPDVVFEEEYLRNGRVKKDGVNINLVLCGWPSFDSFATAKYNGDLSFHTALFHKFISLQLLPCILNGQ